MTITINYYPKKQKAFSIGLGQDVGSLRTLIDILQVFIKGSVIQRRLIQRLEWRISDVKLKEHLIQVLNADDVSPTVDDLTAEYKKLPGKPPSVFAKSLLGALVDGQKWVEDEDKHRVLNAQGDEFKYPMRGWPLRNFISLQLGMGLLNWDRTNGEVTLTELGRKLALAEHSNDEILTDEEKATLVEVFMSYPYTVGFLRALSQSSTEMTQFELGENFGFANEAGFTSFGAQLYVESMIDAVESQDKKLIKEIKANWESTGDKYIRGFASMLQKLGLVKIVNREIPYQDDKGLPKTFLMPAYKLTGQGRKALGFAIGKSSHPRTVKFVMWDMLATHGEVVYIRTVRSLILKALNESNGLTAEQIADAINGNRINEKRVIENDVVTADEVVDHIAGLNGIGLEIDLNGTEFVLKDPISDFEIPVNGDDLPKKSNVLRQQDTLRPYLQNVDHRYLQLIELALDSDSNAEYTQFESLTMELLFKQLDFSGLSLGGASKPDGIAWDEEGNLLIVDTKAYDKGYSLAGNTDKVWRYIEDLRARDDKRGNMWWKQVPENLNSNSDLRFMYVSGIFTGNYMTLLNDLRRRTEAKGGLVEVQKLLLSSEIYLRNEEYSHENLLDEWTNNQVLEEEYFERLVTKVLNEAK